MMNNEWGHVLKEEFHKPYFLKLMKALELEYKHYTIYPKADDLFTAFHLCDYPDVKVVILGQDPYIGERQAHGLAFSVQENTPLPPSLRNIYQEIKDDLGIAMSLNGTLTSWAQQGVFLLNTVLTVRAGVSKSHQNMGWETFTDEVIKKLNERENPIVFLLWGSDAIAKKRLITTSHHLVLTAPHPSPLSSYRGFFGCKHFSKTNAFLIANHMDPIQWKN